MHYTFRTNKKKGPTIRRSREEEEKKKKEWRQCIQILAPKDNPSSRRSLRFTTILLAIFLNKSKIFPPSPQKKREKKTVEKKKTKKSFNRGSNLDITYVESGSLLSEENWRTSGRGVRVKKIRRERWCARLKEERTGREEESKKEGEERERERDRSEDRKPHK